MPAKSQRSKVQRKTVYDTTPLRRRMIVLPAMALGLALVVELLNRGLSPVRLFAFIGSRPVAFGFSVLTILTTLVFSELFKRRRAVLITAALVWLVLGVVEYMVIKERTQPFCSVDILMLKDAFSLITIYYTWAKIIAIFAAGFLAIGLVIMLFARMPRRRRYNFPRSLTAFVGFVLLTAMVAALGVRGEVLPSRFDSLVDAYNDFGFVTCFTFTFGRQGIVRPEEYSPETVAEILTDIGEEPEAEEIVYPVFGAKDNLAHPNLVFVQLESFFDVNTIIGS